ncbi:cache domain-containing protein, partial [Aduncisulcus paluster]
MHPYVSELNGVDVTDHQDANGKKLFIEMISKTEKTGAAYVPYHWQWQDDKTKIYAKISYVKRFQPWEWIIGTGAYIHDIDENAIQQTKKCFLRHWEYLASSPYSHFYPSKATLREIFQQSKELLIILDLDGSIRQANKAVLEMSQLSAHQILTYNLTDIFPGIDQESTENIKKAVNNA